jgi:hypothetical protein
MNDTRTSPNLLHRGWSRLLDGDRVWGSIDIRPDRFGVTRYRLVVFPPGISDAERRRVRAARGWPLWGALVWVFCEIWFSHTMGPWTALIAATGVYLGVGVATTIAAGDQRKQVRTIGAMVMAGYHDPQSRKARDAVQHLAGVLLQADDLLARGAISPTTHEMTWWQVYDRMAPLSVPA